MQEAPAPVPASAAQELAYRRYALSKKLAVARARRDVNAFTEYVMVDPQRRRVRQSGCHVLLQAHYDENRYALAALPRETGKSAQTSVGRPLFEWGQDPNRRFKVVSAEGDLSAKRVIACRTYIEESLRLREVFPHLRRSARGKWTDSAITLERDSYDTEPSMEARGVLATAAGGRCDVLIADDVCDFANSVASPAKRKQVRSSFLEAWMNTLTPNGRVWYVFTPWHQDDLSAHLTRQARSGDSMWKLFRMAVEQIGDNYIPVWPERWGNDRLRERANVIGPVAMARAHKLIAVDDSTCPLLDYVPLMQTRTDPNWLWTGGRDQWVRIIAVDPAIRRNKKSSKTAIICMVLEPNGRRWVDPAHSFVGQLSSPETARKIVAAWRATNAAAVVVENNTYQEALLEWIEETVPGAANIPLERWTTGAQKLDPMVGVPGIAAELARGGHALPFGDQDPDPTGERDILSLLCKQAAEWPVGDGDDALMAWWIASRTAARFDVIDSAGGMHDDWLERMGLDGGEGEF